MSAAQPHQAQAQESVGAAALYGSHAFQPHPGQHGPALAMKVVLSMYGVRRACRSTKTERYALTRVTNYTRLRGKARRTIHDTDVTRLRVHNPQSIAVSRDVINVDRQHVRRRLLGRGGFAARQVPAPSRRKDRHAEDDKDEAGNADDDCLWLVRSLAERRRAIAHHTSTHVHAWRQRWRRDLRSHHRRALRSHHGRLRRL